MTTRQLPTEEEVLGYEFMFTVAPMNFPLATGSPLNPIAVL